MRAPHGDNPYQVLGIERDASEPEIKRAYFTLVREHPPERDPEGFKRIRAAYEQLRASKERAETDLFLIDEPSHVHVLSSLRHADVEPPAITREAILIDLLALEGVFVLEELRSHAGSTTRLPLAPGGALPGSYDRHRR
jgi:curved DNA-binding protein CbpA